MTKLRLTTIDQLPEGYRVRLRTNAGNFFTVIVSEAILRDQDQFAAVVNARTRHGVRPPRDCSWQALIEQRVEASTRRADPVGYYQKRWIQREQEREAKGR